VRLPSLPTTVLVLQVLVGTAVTLAGQSTDPGTLEKRLKQLFPGASNFSSKDGNPPHYTAYAADAGSGEKAVAGYAFWTTELDPLERGYDGPIQMLVGIRPNGVLAGVIVTAHREPYGYFSVDSPEFAKQFVGKDVRDPFKVGADIDAVSRATISITSATRAIRNSARRLARQLLSPPETSK
jgi:NosR/NirI family transcriptional regulator, nitrous oxide reductase regulator